GVGRLRRGGNDPVAADDLVSRHLRLDQMIVDSREGAPAGQTKRGARPGRARRFEVVASAVLVHLGNLSRNRRKYSPLSRFILRSRYYRTASPQSMGQRRKS